MLHIQISCQKCGRDLRASCTTEPGDDPLIEMDVMIHVTPCEQCLQVQREATRREYSPLTTVGDDG